MLVDYNDRDSLQAARTVVDTRQTFSFLGGSGSRTEHEQVVRVSSQVS
jgi:hypothetical protein